MNNSIIKYYGDPSLSDLNNIMITSIHGNAPLQKAHVICISNNVYKPTQASIRASIINEIIQSKTGKANILFLVEGIPLGRDLDERSYTKIIGDNTIATEHQTRGYDDLLALQTTLSTQNTLYQLHQLKDQIDSQYTAQTIHGNTFLSDTGIPLNTIFQKDYIPPAKMDYLHAFSEQISKTTQTLFTYTEMLSRMRSFSLYQAIQIARQEHPETLVVALGKAKIFRNISQELDDIEHCIVELKNYTTL